MEVSGLFKFSIYIHVVLLKTFQSKLNYNSTPNVREAMEFYNLGDQSFKTSGKGIGFSRQGKC